MPSNHVLERLCQRYPNQTWHFKDLAGICNVIHDGKAKLICTHEHGAGEYLVPYNGRRIRVIYRFDLKLLVTVLELKGNKKPDHHKVILRNGRKHRAA